MFSSGLARLSNTLPQNHQRIMLTGSAKQITAKTIEKMQELVGYGKRDFNLRPLIGKLIKSCGFKDYHCQAKKIFEFCQTHITYAFDPNGVELIESPAKILESCIGDCDSKAVLFCSLCEAIGFPCAFVTIKADRTRPDEYSHVYNRVKIPNKGWITADPTMQQSFGFDPNASKTYPEKIWEAATDSGLSAMDFAGMGYLPYSEIATPTGNYLTEFRSENMLEPENANTVEMAQFNGNHVMFSGLGSMGSYRYLGADEAPTDYADLAQSIYDGSKVKELQAISADLKKQIAAGKPFNTLKQKVDSLADLAKAGKTVLDKTYTSAKIPQADRGLLTIGSISENAAVKVALTAFDRKERQVKKEVENATGKKVVTVEPSIFQKYFTPLNIGVAVGVMLIGYLAIRKRA